MAPRSIKAANDYDSGTFVNNEFGFSIEWDTDVWTGSNPGLDDPNAGVAFESLSSWAQIHAFKNRYEDATACLDDMVGIMAEDDGVTIEDFGVARARLPRPEPMDGAEAELYSYTFTSDEGDLDQLLYLSCAVLPSDAAIEIFIATTPDMYEDVLEEWDDLIAGITVDGVSDDANTGNDQTGDDAGIEDGVYESAEAGFGVEWDAALWNATEVDEGEQGLGVELDSPTSFALISAVTGDYAVDPEECLQQMSGFLEAGDVVENFRVASARIERPEAAPDSTSELYTFLNTDFDSKYAAYFECRPLDNGGVLTIQFAAEMAVYEDELPRWQKVLDAITIGTIPDFSANIGIQDDQATPESGDSVVGPNHGVEIPYDDSVWTPTDYSNDRIDQFTFDSEFGQVQVMTLDVAPDLEGCMQTLLDTEQEYATDTIDVAPRSVDRPKTVRNAEAELYSFQMDGNDGPIDVLYYVECRNVNNGDGLLAVTFTTVPSVWDAALPAFESLLAGIDA